MWTACIKIRLAGCYAPGRTPLVFADWRTSGHGAQRIGVGCSGLDQHVIHVAVAPVFSGLEGPDNRVSRVVEVLGRVLVLRFIATTYVPANQAFTQVDPPIPGPEALLAALG